MSVSRRGFHLAMTEQLANHRQALAFPTNTQGLPGTLPELLEKGVKGIGEGPTTGAPAAVMGAVRPALSTVGTTTIDMPVTPERIWRAIRTASGPPRDAGSGT